MGKPPPIVKIVAQAGKPEAAPFDLLCHPAFNAPSCPHEASARRGMLIRHQRADRVNKQQIDFFKFFAPEAREILNDLLEKYATGGELRFTLPDVLKLPPISKYGNVSEIAQYFGGFEELGKAANQLQTLLYAD